ncbi:MAG TPA: TonB family protein [Candidatus Acidoferrales bacterium]|nr:TonB family protein [Candidatus Acidoferrales bacterium]
MAAATIRPEANLSRFVFSSAVLHALLAAVVAIFAYVSTSGESWGGPGGSVTVGLVGGVPAIPLPQPEVVSPNRVVDESKGLYKSEPQPKPRPEPEATPIPKFERDKPPRFVTRPSRTLENRTPPPPNAVPYGAGGTPMVPVTSFTIGSTGATAAGLAIGGNSGGDFASRFASYVTAVQQRISREWLQSSVDPSLTWAPRVSVAFDILRDGTVTNLQLIQSSNNRSLDTSALRAVQSANPLLPLPAAYSGSRVSVEFYFDYRR